MSKLIFTRSRLVVDTALEEGIHAEFKFQGNVYMVCRADESNRIFLHWTETFEDNYFIDITNWALKCPGLTEKAERIIKKAVV